MNDEQLKKEIEEAFAVEPSPQFVARVRHHVRSEPGRFSIGFPWKALGAGLAAAAVVTAIAVLKPQEPAAPKTSQIVQTPERQIETPAAGGEIEKPKAVEPPKVAPRSHATEPEVLIDPREAAAFRSFLEDVEDRKIDAGRLAELFEEAEKARSMVDIAPMPIVIRPLSLAAPDKEGGSL